MDDKGLIEKNRELNTKRERKERCRYALGRPDFIVQPEGEKKGEKREGRRLILLPIAPMNLTEREKENGRKGRGETLMTTTIGIA